MRISISSLAWDPLEDGEVAGMLNERSIDAIDLVPSKYFPLFPSAGPDEIARIRDWWARRGIEIIGMQSLLYGTSGLNVFGDESSRDSLLAHLVKVFRIAHGLGASRLVFGSPKNRDRTGLDDERTMSLAVEFFRRAGDAAAEHDAILCLEPNPPRYGANFMIDSFETHRVVEAVGHNHIRMQLDSGAMAINGEDPEFVVPECADVAGHVHASEPDLVALGSGSGIHDKYAKALKAYMGGSIVSIEMLPAKEGDRLSAIRGALDFALAKYR